MTEPMHASSRTSMERVTRKLVDEAADELVAYLGKLPENGLPPPHPLQTVDCMTPRDETRAKILALREVIDHYFGE